MPQTTIPTKEKPMMTSRSRSNAGSANKENDETKRKMDQLTGEVSELKGAMAEMVKKQLTEEVVKTWFQEVIDRQLKEATTTSSRQLKDASTGGYRSVEQLEQCSMARSTLET